MLLQKIIKILFPKGFLTPQDLSGRQPKTTVGANELNAPAQLIKSICSGCTTSTGKFTAESLEHTVFTSSVTSIINPEMMDDSFLLLVKGTAAVFLHAQG